MGHPGFLSVLKKTTAEADPCGMTNQRTDNGEKQATTAAKAKYWGPSLRSGRQSPQKFVLDNFTGLILFCSYYDFWFSDW